MAGLGNIGGAGLSLVGGGQVRQAGAGTRRLGPEEQAEVRRLKQRDREVRQHEQAHMAAAGRYAKGGARLSFTTGPDGRQYATGGEVSIDTSAASTPEATIRKMGVVKRAAVAPGQPSAQDRAVFTQAAREESKARSALAKEKREQSVGKGRSFAPEAVLGATGIGGTSATGDGLRPSGQQVVQRYTPLPPTPATAIDVDV